MRGDPENKISFIRPDGDDWCGTAHIDEISADRVRGWAAYPIEVIVNRRFVFPLTPQFDREDVIAAGLTGRGFDIIIQDVLPGYAPREIYVRRQGGTSPLPNGYWRDGEIHPHIYVESNPQAFEHHERLIAGATRAAVLFTSRSGGTYLLDVLGRNPHTYAVAEPLDLLLIYGDAAARAWLHDFYMLPSSIEYHKFIRDPKTMILSTKLNKLSPTIFSTFNYYNTRYIRLYRKNVLKQAFSDYSAHFYLENRRDFNSRKTTNRMKLFIDPAELMRRIGVFLEQEQKVDELIALLAKGDVMGISYEEIVGPKRDEVFRRIFDYLEVPPSEVSTDLKKLNSDDLSQVIENYEEVYKAIRATRFGWMLEE